jgi:hypothetical protein
MEINQEQAGNPGASHTAAPTLSALQVYIYAHET